MFTGHVNPLCEVVYVFLNVRPVGIPNAGFPPLATASRTSADVAPPDAAGN
jgi:hypothetical protein